ncbi:MAG: protein kinase [Gemmatimonadales bacterium]
MNIPGTPEPRRTPLPSPDEWRRLGPLVDAMLDASPEGRAALLTELNGGDAAMRLQIEHLVAECERGYPLLDALATDRFDAIVSGATLAMPTVLAGRYRVEHEVGHGGMAIVYLARDLKHGRDVAVKVVRPELAAALGRERFLREIEIAARLRHPHIVPLYDSGEFAIDAEEGAPQASLLYYVMPYEVGHSLRDRLEQEGPMPVHDVVLIVRDVCEALAHAHQHGIVHRDIKPDNVLLSAQHALVTDFGVAHAATEATVQAAGVVGSTPFGTPVYMAPEQASRQAHVDHRADIYAVGVLAYELLAGHPPIEPEDPLTRPSGHVARAIGELRSLRPDVSEDLAGLIARCLAAQPADRWQSADALLAALPTGTVARALAAERAPRRVWAKPAQWLTAILSGVGVLTAATFALLAVTSSRHRADEAPMRLGISKRITSEPGLEVQPSISADGRHVAYATGNSLRMRIAVRPVADGRSRWLTADSTMNEWLPRWSPDGTRILFLAGGGVFSASAAGGPVREEVSPRPGAIVLSATWSGDGREIAYTRGDSLLARTVGSEETRLITTVRDLHSCRWSPDGFRLACVSGNAYYVTVGATSGIGPMFGNLAPSRIVLVSAAGGRPESVTDSSSLHQSPAWSRDGQTLYYVSNREGPRDIYAVDVRSVARSPRVPVRVTTGLNAQSLDFQADGSRLVYAKYESIANIWALPIPASQPGSSTSGVPMTSGNQTIEGVRVSTDGRWLLYDSDLRGNSDIYRMPLVGGDAERLTHDSTDEFRGVLSPDGRELAYHSHKSGSRNIFLLPIDGGIETQLTRSSEHLTMANWSPDGTALALFSMTTSRVLVMRREANGRWKAPRFTGGRGWRAEWAPDGSEIAFVSPLDGRIGIVPADSGAQRDIYVPREGDPLAELAIFAASGRELYFKSHDASGRAAFWSIPVTGGRPRLIVRFDDPARSSNRFDFASDGRRLYFTLEDRQSDVWVAEVAADGYGGSGRPR